MGAKLIRYEKFLANPQNYLVSNEYYWEFSQGQEKCKKVNDSQVTRIFLEGQRFHVVQGKYTGNDNNIFFPEADYAHLFTRKEMKEHKHFKGLRKKRGIMKKEKNEPF